MKLISAIGYDGRRICLTLRCSGARRTAGRFLQSSWSRPLNAGVGALLNPGKDLSSRRTELSEAARHVLGLSFSRGYSPHVSLGYFANREHGQVAEARIEHWTETFREELKDSIVTYSSLDVYGFTDMASFFKVTTSGGAIV